MKIPLNQCPFTLQDMEISEKKIHCSSCSKNLVDFRGKTPNQIKEELKTFTQTPCGVFSKSQVETKSYIIPRFAFSKKYVAAVFLAVGLFPTWAKAQIEPKADSTISIAYTDSLSKFGTLTGTVTDDLGDPLPGATVVIKNGTIIETAGTTNLDGKFKLSPLSPGTYTVEISFVGLKQKKIEGVIFTPSKTTKIKAVLYEDYSDLLILGEACGSHRRLINADWSGKTYTREEIRQIW
jgi:hypothetical protein